jgi:heat shock protein HslJ
MLDGEGLAFGQMGVTMMGCPEAMMTQEQRMLDALQHVVRFDIDETGALLLIGPAGETLLIARRLA